MFNILDFNILNANVFSKSSGGMVTFLFRVNINSLCFLLKPQPWKSGKVKHEIIPRNCMFKTAGIAKLFKTKNLRKWENFKAVYLSFHWFNDSWTRGFELVSREFEIGTRGFEIANLTHTFWISTRVSKLSNRN